MVGSLYLYFAVITSTLMKGEWLYEKHEELFESYVYSRNDIILDVVVYELIRRFTYILGIHSAWDGWRFNGYIRPFTEKEKKKELTKALLFIFIVTTEITP